MFILIFEQTKLYMYKNILIVLACLIFANVCHAQSAVESNIEIAKVNQPCIMATYNFSEDLLIETIKAKMTEAKVPSPDKSKGFKVYSGVVLPAFGTEKLDIYIKTDGKKQTSICYIAISKGYDNFISKTTDTTTIANVMAWLNNLNGDASKIQLGHDIEDGTSMQNKSDKRYNSSVEDGKDLQKDLEKVQQKILENKAEQAKLLKELEEAKAKVLDLKSKLK
jgi:hypothetical protein